MNFDFVTYMETIAGTLKDLAATGTRENFFRASNLSNIEEFLQNQTTTAETAMIVLDVHTGKFENRANDESIWDDRLFTYFLVKHVGLHDFDAREAAIEACKNSFYKITAKMLKDKRSDHLGNNENGLQNLDMGSINYDTIGPIGDQFYGVMVNFSILSEAMPKLVYNANDWS